MQPEVRAGLMTVVIHAAYPIKNVTVIGLYCHSPLKLFISLKFCRLEMILDMDTNRCLDKDMTKFPHPPVRNQQHRQVQSTKSTHCPRAALTPPSRRPHVPPLPSRYPEAAATPPLRRPTAPPRRPLVSPRSSPRRLDAGPTPPSRRSNTDSTLLQTASTLPHRPRRRATALSGVAERRLHAAGVGMGESWGAG